MATFTNKRKVLSIAGEVTVIISIGKKEAHMCQEFGVVNSTIKMIWKHRSKLLVHLN
jgi:hypothetical protein